MSQPAQDWTAQRVAMLAPDDASLKAGQGLARAAKWQTLGMAEQIIWGEIKGSGSSPYQVRIDTKEPAYKCSCPSRKFPCKHSIGLLLILAGEPGAMKSAAPPEWVAQWLAGREQRAAKKVEKAEEAAAKPVDAEAQAKRRAQRRARVAAGLEEVEVVLQDVVRQGLAAAPENLERQLNAAAARMIDAQAPGVARLLREMAACVNSGAGWQQRLLVIAGRLHLMARAFPRCDTLPEPLGQDLLTAIGFTTKADELLASTPAVRDRWHVAGQTVEKQDALTVARTWLMGEKTKRPALVLSFAAGAQPLDLSLTPATRVEMELVFYPSAAPLRAIVKQRHETTLDPSLAGTSIDSALDDYASAIAANPWIEEWPLSLSEVSFMRLREAGRERWAVRDSAGSAIPLIITPAESLILLSASLGRPSTVFGVYDGWRLRPLSIAAEGRMTLVHRGEMSLYARAAS